MTEWQSVAIGELGRVVTGKTPPAARPDDFGREHPFVTPTDMVDQRFMKGTARYLSSEGADLLRRLKVPPGSVMVSCIGWQLGKVAISTSESFTNQQINTIVPDTAKVDSRFLFYHLRTRRDELKRLASGGTRTPILNKSRFAALLIALPPMRQQERIVHVLGALDDLIENNRRRVELLEEMARSIYREWFVHFRYPGHENVALDDSILGPIPVGWKAEPLSAVSELQRTSVQLSAFPTELFDHHSIPAFDREQLPALELGATIKSAKFLVAEASVLVSKLNPRIERTWFVEPDSARRSMASTEFLILRPKAQFSLEWLYLLARSDSFRERLTELSGGTSTSHQRTKPDDFLAMKVVTPTRHECDRFTSVVAPPLAAARNLRVQVRRLGVLRDLLLPKLLTGQIDVSALNLDALLAERVA